MEVQLRIRLFAKRERCIGNRDAALITVFQDEIIGRAIHHKGYPIGMRSVLVVGLVGAYK